MRPLLALLIFVMHSWTTYSQDAELATTRFANRNSVQVEAFGHGLFYSLNYERVIFNGQRFKTTGQLGIAYYPPSANLIDLWIPLVVNELYSFNKHHIELGFGHVFVNVSSRDYNNEIVSREWDGFLTGRLGYRFQKPNGRFLMRVGFTPFLEYRDYIDFHPSGALSFGYNF
jgi:hypothetical protein